MLKLTVLFDSLRHAFTAREIVDFYLGLPVYCKKRVRETGEKRNRVDKTQAARRDLCLMSEAGAKSLLIGAGMAAEHVATAVTKEEKGTMKLTVSVEEAAMAG